MEPTHFNHLGDSPCYFVPDTGSRGAEGTLTCPDGTVIELADPLLSPPSDTKPDGTPWETTLGPRVGFLLAPFDQEGDYILRMHQEGDEDTVYVIRVTPKEA
jgi:hypothetical protein